MDGVSTRKPAADVGNNWEDLRREARKLEGEIDIKIAAYGKLCSSYEYGYAKGESGLSTDQMLQLKGSEVDTLLARLTDITTRMGTVVSTGTGDGRSHTLARHRDILHDFSQEYRRLSSIAGAAKDRAELLGGGDGAGRGGGDVSNSSTGLLMRERGTLDRSSFALDGVLGQAQSVATNLAQQRQVFDAVNSKVMALGAKYPVVNSLLNAVRRRKNRDSVILAAVAGMCLLLILIYWARK